MTRLQILRGAALGLAALIAATSSCGRSTTDDDPTSTPDAAVDVAASGGVAGAGGLGGASGLGGGSSAPLAARRARPARAREAASGGHLSFRTRRMRAVSLASVSTAERSASDVSPALARTSTGVRPRRMQNAAMQGVPVRHGVGWGRERLLCTDCAAQASVASAACARAPPRAVRHGLLQCCRPGSAGQLDRGVRSGG
jgi:hypothetical protein